MVLPLLLLFIFVPLPYSHPSLSLGKMHKEKVERDKINKTRRGKSLGGVGRVGDTTSVGARSAPSHPHTRETPHIIHAVLPSHLVAMVSSHPRVHAVLPSHPPLALFTLREGQGVPTRIRDNMLAQGGQRQGQAGRERHSAERGSGDLVLTYRLPTRPGAVNCVRAQRLTARRSSAGINLPWPRACGTRPLPTCALPQPVRARTRPARGQQGRVQCPARQTCDHSR